jgi:transposase-like protein
VIGDLNGFVYRAVDDPGQIIDMLVSAHRAAPRR